MEQASSKSVPLLSAGDKLLGGISYAKELRLVYLGRNGSFAP